MRLYHFTEAAFVPLIREHGLKAKIHPHFSIRGAVVCLTSVRTTALTLADRKWHTDHGSSDLAQLPTWLAGTDRRLTVTLDRRDPRLVPMKMFMKAATKWGVQGIAGAIGLMPCARHWYAYLGDVPPGAISDWDCTEGTGVALWPRTDAARIAHFAECKTVDAPSIVPDKNAIKTERV